MAKIRVHPDVFAGRIGRIQAESYYELSVAATLRENLC